MGRRAEVMFWSIMILLVALAGGAIMIIDNALTANSFAISNAIKPTLLCLSLVGLNIASYLVWFNRWNVIAHTQLVFSVVAYVIPIYYLHTLDVLSGPALDLYYQVIALGFLCCTIGVFAGAAIAGRRRSLEVAAKYDFEGMASAVIRKRTFRLMALCVLGVLVAFAVMGFIPATTDDPLAAKFFRGAYAEAYRPVAPLYRFSTTVIALLLPLVAMYAWKKRSVGPIAMLAAACGVMILGLLREPAVSGILLFIGVFLAWKGRKLPLYFALLVGAYFAGAALYSVLAALGLGGFAGGSAGVADGSLLAQVAWGAPDLRDQVGFLTHWLSRPEYTDGRTFVGGLIPSNYQWNPSVWSLHVVNPSQSITSISSGGLRLPAPLWGLVSFGWTGVVVVSFFHGLFMGFLARRFKHLITGAPIVTATCWLVLYAALLDVVPVFFRLSYLSVIQLAVIVWLLGAAKTRAGSKAAAASAAKRQTATQRTLVTAERRYTPTA